MNQARLNKIISVIRSKKATEPCPRCSNDEFSVVGESEIIIDVEQRGLLRRSSASTIPTIVISCTNCGYLSHHAQGPLGLMENNNYPGGE